MSRSPGSPLNKGGQGRSRTADLPLFRRTLYQLSYLTGEKGRRRCVCTPAAFLLATQTGLEPATSAVTGRHANQLRYWARLLDDATPFFEPC